MPGRIVFGLVSVLSAVLVIGCAKTQRIDLDCHYEESDWCLRTSTGTKMETDHYRVYTTVKDKAFQEAAIKLAECQYQRFHALIPREPKDEMSVYIFSNTRQWIAFTQSKFPPAVASLYLKIRSGGYASGDFAAFYYMGRYPTLTIMAHELFHLYLSRICGSEPVPAWVNEGLACYFEAHEWDGEKPVFTPSKNLFRRQNLADAIGANKLFTLKELLSTDAGKVCNESQARMLVYYAELWGLMQFLQDSHSGYCKQFQCMLSELGTHEMTMRVNGYLTTSPGMSFGEATFRAYITENVECFEQAFNKYLKGLAGI